MTGLQLCIGTFSWKLLFLVVLSFLFLYHQLPRNRTPLVKSVPELGVVFTQQKDEWLGFDGDHYQQSPTRSISQQHTFRQPCDLDDRGAHLYVHPEDGEESEEEVTHHIIHIEHAVMI